MRLMTVTDAAAELYVSKELVFYWARNGLLTKHPYALSPLSVKVRKRTVSTRRFLVDLDEVRSIQRTELDEQLKRLHSDKRLLRPGEVSQMLDVRTERVYSWVKRFKLKKYYPKAGTHYLIDGDELADNLEDAGLWYLIK